MVLISSFVVPKPFDKANPIEIVLFCGSPGAGKSSFYWKHLQPLGYARVNQDILKTVSSPHVMHEPKPHVLSNTVQTAREMRQSCRRAGRRRYERGYR